MARVEAKPNRQLLVWARENAGYSTADAARRLQTTESRLQSWESGESRPTLSQLRELAAYYRRPLAFFYLPEPPRKFEAMHDFRLLPGAEAPESPALRLEIRRAWERRDIALELLEQLGEAPPEVLGASLGDDEEALAARAREWLGVTAVKQEDWGQTPHGALREWRAAIESRGVLALQATGVRVEEMRGFSIARRPLPVVVANIKDAPRGRVFTLLHELVHVLLRENSLCDGREAAADRRVELFCNRVAAAILVPRDELIASSVVRGHRGEAWIPQDLSRLVRRFGGVSEEALLLRMVGLRLASQQFYDERREAVAEHFAQQRARDVEDGGFVPPHRVAMAALGPTFTRLVLEGFDREKISASDVADFLGMRLKHLDEVRNEMRRAS